MAKKNAVKTPQATTWERLFKIVIGGTVAAVVVFLSFVWPSTTSSIKNIEIAVAGPQPVAENIARSLEQAGETFDPRVADDREEAVRLIEKREVSGAIVVGENPEVLLASANGPAITQILSLSQLPQQLGGTNQDTAVLITDVVPLIESDPRGFGLTVTALPLVFAGIIGGILVSLAVFGVRQKLFGVLAYSVLSGLVLGLVVRYWLDLLPGNYLSISLVIAAAVLAISSVITGLNSLLGRKGLGLGAAFTMLLANPLSGAAQPVQFLAEPWGAIGQYLVPGAGTTLLRNVAYFPEAAIVTPAAVLLGWIVLGTALILHPVFVKK